MPGRVLALALAAALPACRDQVDAADGGLGDCPAFAPTAGQPCGAPAVCGYPVAVAGTDCSQSFTCTDSVWQPAGDDCPTPPPPGSCPSAIPGAGAPCKSPGQVCTFDVPGECPGVFLATCAAGGWSIADQSPPCMPHPCPAVEPTAGTPCDYPYSCTYTVVPPGCPPRTEDATCTGGMWKIDAPAICGP
jgi:hypothetical protein